MPTRDGYPEGIPSWVDLATTDVETAKDFYSKLFGWEYLEPQDESMPYWMATRDGKLAAGIGPTQGDQSFSAWSTYFAVEDADETAAEISRAGGQIVVEPTDIPEAGRMAMATDPAGAIFGIWQAGTHKGAEIVNEHGALNWNELTSNDLDRALRFYATVLGHDHETSQGLSGPYTTISVGGRAVAGAMPPPDPAIPNNWGVYFAVDDVNEALETAVAGGGQHVYGPMEIEGVGTFLGIADPTGAQLTLIQLATDVD